ncbi:MAG: hypothetical protein Kow0092_18410 [Deferrisomatales bacterium]
MELHPVAAPIPQSTEAPPKRGPRDYEKGVDPGKGGGGVRFPIPGPWDPSPPAALHADALLATSPADGARVERASAAETAPIPPRRPKRSPGHVPDDPGKVGSPGQYR